MLTNSYIHFLSHLKMSLARKSYFFDIKLTKQNMPLVRILKAMNVIRRFKKINNSNFRVYPFFYKRHNFFHYIKVYANRNSTVTLNQTSLRLLKLSSSSQCVILETPKGILSLAEALRLKVGGRLICVLL